MTDGGRNEIWIRINEHQQAVLSLEMFWQHLQQTRTKSYHWQWVVLGLHNSLQGFMVLGLRGTDNLNVLTEECAQDWLLAYQRGDGNYPREKLDGFLDLYKKIKSNRMKIYINSKSFKPKGTQGKSVKKLNSLRNEFVHFVPKGWSLEISGLPQIVNDCLGVIEFLAFESNNVVWHEVHLESQTKQLIEEARRELVKQQ